MHRPYIQELENDGIGFDGMKQETGAAGGRVVWFPAWQQSPECSMRPPVYQVFHQLWGNFTYR
jgi:hypothetical protein